METNIYLYISPMSLPSESHEKLRKAIAQYLKELGANCAETDAFSWNVGENRYGKPFFAEAPWIHFSISHSGSYWACAVADQPIGLDLQLRRKKGDRKSEQHSRRIAERFFHADEKEWLLRGGDFYDLWTAKESYVKYTGRGIGDDFDRFAVADTKGLLKNVKSQKDAAPQIFHIDPGVLAEQLADYSCCICAAQVGDVRIRMI